MRMQQEQKQQPRAEKVVLGVGSVMLYEVPLEPQEATYLPRWAQVRHDAYTMNANELHER